MTGDRILLKLLDTITNFGNVDELYPWDHHTNTMATHGVPYRPCMWFGPLTSAQRMACTRAMRSLVMAKLVCRVSDAARERVRYLVPTRAGLERALSLAGNIDRRALRDGLERTAWGRELADLVQSTDDLSLQWADTDLTGADADLTGADTDLTGAESSLQDTIADDVTAHPSQSQ